MDLSTTQVFQGDCLDLIKEIPDASIDAVVSDPPYGYLKHRLDRAFDEDALFAEFKRILKPAGAIVLFGRGVPFFRWGVKLDALGFAFKESICWDKGRTSSPTRVLQRVHEDVFIFGGKGFSVRKCHVPYAEVRTAHFEPEKMKRDVQHLAASLKHPDRLKEAFDFLAGAPLRYRSESVNFSHTVQGGIKMADRGLSVLRSMQCGFVESDLIRVLRESKTMHETQKPVRLMERLVGIVSDSGAIVLDPFAGSASTLLACKNTGRVGIGFEIDADYFALASERLNGF